MNYKKQRQIKVDEQIDDVGYNYCSNKDCKTPRYKVFNFTCHHIYYRSERRNHPMLHHLLNLIILCDVCHIWYHNKKSNRDKLVEERNLKQLFN